MFTKLLCCLCIVQTGAQKSEVKDQKPEMEGKIYLVSNDADLKKWKLHNKKKHSYPFVYYTAPTDHPMTALYIDEIELGGAKNDELWIFVERKITKPDLNIPTQYVWQTKEVPKELVGKFNSLVIVQELSKVQLFHQKWTTECEQDH